LSLADAGSTSTAQASVAEVAAELQKLRYVHTTLERELVTLKSRLAEVSEARRVLSAGIARRCFRFLGGLLIEVSKEEAMKYLEEEEEALKIRIDTLEKERTKTLEKIRELERNLKVV